MELSKQEAAKLAEEIREGLANVSKAVDRFINGRGWKALGYNSLTEWWQATMTDAPAASVLPMIVYQMLDEGASVDDLAASIKGVGRDTAEFLARQRSNKVPVELASTTHKSQQKKGSYVATLFIYLPTEELRRWRRLAVDLDATVEELAIPVLKHCFDELGRKSA